MKMKKYGHIKTRLDAYNKDPDLSATAILLRHGLGLKNNIHLEQARSGKYAGIPVKYIDNF